MWEYDGPDVDSDDEVQRALAQAESDDEEEALDVEQALVQEGDEEEESDD